jgi:hypothetical protein
MSTARSSRGVTKRARWPKHINQWRVYDVMVIADLVTSSMMRGIQNGEISRPNWFSVLYHYQTPLDSKTINVCLIANMWKTRA